MQQPREQLQAAAGAATLRQNGPPTLSNLVAACQLAAQAPTSEHQFWGTVCLLESLTVDHPNEAIDALSEILQALPRGTERLCQRSQAGEVISVDYSLHDDNDIARLAAQIALTSDGNRRQYLVEAAALLLLENACADMTPLLDDPD